MGWARLGWLRVQKDRRSVFCGHSQEAAQFTPLWEKVFVSLFSVVLGVPCEHRIDLCTSTAVGRLLCGFPALRCCGIAPDA